MSPETTARILWAVPWAAFAITIIVAGGGIFAGAIAVIGALMIGELFGMARVARPYPAVAMLTTAGLIAAAYFGDQYQMVLALAAMFPLLFVFVVLRGTISGVTGSVAVTILGVAWIGLPLAHAVLLRELPDHGGALLVDVLVATIVADTAAYGGGRAFGRHKLATVISPGKTVEGLAFGIVGGTAGFWFAGLYQDWLSGTDALALGAVIALVAPLGDLFESMVKRDLGVKDSGTAVGPHGGLLDRLDAVLFTIVAGYYLSVAFVY
ncbi:phosphatidate cytidylyltransferase [soil metagenome]|jgi:phosphatidate cytidylyltransferase